MSLWADYSRDRLGWETIEEADGFITYSLAPPNCTIEEFYVAPHARGGRTAKRLADAVVEVAKGSGATFVWGKVIPGTNGAEHAMKTNLHYGFRLIGAENGKIIMLKEIGG